jgi:hypothetical protein
MGEGRDFLQFCEDNGLKDSWSRKKAMQVGDYINMPAMSYKEWTNFASCDVNSFSADGIIKVEVMKINDSGLIIVKADGFEKTIDGSMFCNYGRAFSH